MANLVISGGPKIRAVTNPLRGFLASGASSVAPELSVMSVDGSSVEASFSGAAPSSLADISKEVVRDRFVGIIFGHWLKRGDDKAACGWIVLILVGESVEMVKA